MQMSHPPSWTTSPTESKPRSCWTMKKDRAEEVRQGSKGQGTEADDSQTLTGEASLLCPGQRRRCSQRNQDSARAFRTSSRVWLLRRTSTRSSRRGPTRTGRSGPGLPALPGPAHPLQKSSSWRPPSVGRGPGRLLGQYY